MKKTIFVVFSDSFQELTFIRNGLLEAVNLYLNNPGLHAKGRKAILDHLCHGGSGSAKQAVVKEILKLF